MIVDSVWRIANINALRRRCPRPWPRSPRHNLPDSGAGHPRSRRHSGLSSITENWLPATSCRLLASGPWHYLLACGSILRLSASICGERLPFAPEPRNPARDARAVILIFLPELSA